ncbi:Type II inositol 1,4,5-trisphosphate 5-phosphatase [Gonapodya sp. JEL0774]|nr:Type II inositol 1,4,5-trisphosphate 5-phosphatase [Gonapodya sp. JEL0774]
MQLESSGKLRVSFKSAEIRTELEFPPNAPTGTVEEIRRLVHVARYFPKPSTGFTFLWTSFYLTSPYLDGPSEPVSAGISVNPFIEQYFPVPQIHHKLVKDVYTSHILRREEPRFLTLSEPRILWVGTYNVGGVLPAEDLSPWLDVDSDADEPAIYVIGLQEMDLSTEAYLFTDAGAREEAWCQRIEAALGKRKASYTKIASKQLVGLLIVVYAQKADSNSISDVSTSSVGVGFLRMGNKGATAVRFRWHDSYVTVVNCHLAADTSALERRNQDFQELIRKVTFEHNTIGSKFGNAHYNPSNTLVSTVTGSFYEQLLATHLRSDAPIPEGAPPIPESATLLGYQPRATATVMDGDHLIFLGDLNYRLALPVDKPALSSTIKSMLIRGEIPQLLESDQLKTEIAAERTFVGFHEAQITFPPTYKYDVGTTEFDSSEKNRAPAWCDRILHFAPDASQSTLPSAPRPTLTPVLYTSTPELVGSDHKPVKCVFEVRCRRIEEQRFGEVVQEAARDLDKFENEAVPALSLSTNSLDLGVVSYGMPVTRTLTIANTGLVAAKFHFAPPTPDSSFVSPPWLWPCPAGGALLPGESVTVRVTALVAGNDAGNMTMGKAALDEILVVRCEDARDAFVAVHGEWQSSCFGLPLRVLCALPEPARSLGVERVKKVAEESNKPESKSGANFPREMWRLVDFIFRYRGECESVFLKGGDSGLMKHFRDCLDTGEEFDVVRLFGVEGEGGDGEDQGAPEGDHTTSESASRSSTASDTTTTAENVSRVPPSRPRSSSLAALRRDLAVHSSAQTLLMMLDAFPGGLVPQEYFAACVREGGRLLAVNQAGIQGLGSEAREVDVMESGVGETWYNVWVNLCTLIRDVAEDGINRGNAAAVDELACVFAPILLRPPSTATVDDVGQQWRRAFFAKQFRST